MAGRMTSIAVGVVTTTLLFVAAGCGGPSAEEKYAGSVCTEISDWEDQIQKSANDVKEKLQSPETGMLAAIDADVQEAIHATDELAANLKSLEPPDTEEGRQAQQQLEALIAQIETTVTKTKQTIESVPQGASTTETLEKLAPLAPAIRSLAVNTSSTLASIKASGSKLKEGFDKADSCEQFR
jgi:uncharacterized protein YicC (UPF0701 family)